MAAQTENRDAIDALPAYEWAELDVGLLKLMPTKVIVIPRSPYVQIVENLLEGRHLPTTVRANLIKTARTADRFALGEWIQGTRGCGCLIGEYLVATHEIAEHNSALDARRDFSTDNDESSIEERDRRRDGQPREAPPAARDRRRDARLRHGLHP